MKKEIKFLSIFLLLASILYFIVWKFYSENVPIIGANSITFVLDRILHFAGINTIIDEDKIYFPNNSSLTIILECTGLYEMIILSSIIVSYPTNLMNKLYGIISGLSIIYILNMIRLVTIAYVLLYYANEFDLIERYLWQISLVILISVAYTIWLKTIDLNSSSNSL